MKDRIAILTGDIVAPDALGPERTEAVIAALAAQAGQMAAWLGHDLIFSPTRGNGWQIVVGAPPMALRTALALSATARTLGKDVATRISIGLGNGEMPRTGDLNTQTGPAFAASGAGLQQMPDGIHLTHSGPPPVAALTRLMDQIANGWTPAQAQAMRLALDPAGLTQTEIAARLGKSRQTIAQALDGAGAAAVLSALGRIEEKHKVGTQ